MFDRFDNKNMRFDLLNGKIYFLSPWRIKNKDGFVCINPVQEKSIQKKGLFEVSKIYYNCQDLEGKRIIVKNNGTLCYILDSVHTCEPVSLYTDFYLDNSLDDVSCNVPNPNRIVVRSEEMFSKFFRLDNCLDGENRMEKTGLLLPDKNTEKNGDIKLSFYEGIHGAFKTHMALYGICSGGETKCWDWHFTGANWEYAANAPSDETENFGVRISKGVLEAICPSTQEVLLKIAL